MSFNATGLVSIEAVQQGDSNWNAAFPVTNTFEVIDPALLKSDSDGDGLLDADDPCPFYAGQPCGGDQIGADGKIWFQPNLFTGLSRSNINAV